MNDYFNNYVPRQRFKLTFVVSVPTVKFAVPQPVILNVNPPLISQVPVHVPLVAHVHVPPDQVTALGEI